MQNGEEGNQNKDDSKRSNDNFSVKAPELSLPKGGSAIRDIGEKFAANQLQVLDQCHFPTQTDSRNYIIEMLLDTFSFQFCTL